MDIIQVQSCSDRSFVTYQLGEYIELVTIVFSGYGGGYLPVLGLSPEQATVAIKATGITPTEVKLFKDRYVFKYELQKTKSSRSVSAVSAYPPENIKSEKCFVVTLTSLNKDTEKEVDSKHVVTGNNELTVKMVERVALNFIAEGSNLCRAPKEEGDNVFLYSGYTKEKILYWVGSVVEADAVDAPALLKYLENLPYETLLGYGEVEIL